MRVLLERASGTTPKAGMISLTVSVFNDAGAAPAVLWRGTKTRGGSDWRTPESCFHRLIAGRRAAGWRIRVHRGSYPGHVSVRIVARHSGRSEDTFGESLQEWEEKSGINFAQKASRIHLCE
jgi:hypothetical protein